MSTPSSKLQPLINAYLKKSQLGTLQMLADHINAKLNGHQKSFDIKSIYGNDFSKLYSETISKTALQTIALFFGSPISNLPPNFEAKDFHHSGTDNIVSELKSQLVPIIQRRISDAPLSGDEPKIERATTNFSSTLELLYGVTISHKKEGLTQADKSWLQQKLKEGNVALIKDILDRGTKLSDRTICELAQELLDRCSEPKKPNDIEPSDFDRQDFATDVKRSKNFERSRSQIAGLTWPKPYRNQWIYVDNGIKSLSSHKGAIKEYFCAHDDHMGTTDESQIGSNVGIEHIPASAENFAFIYDPNQTKYISEFKIASEPAGPNTEWQIPRRFGQPAYLALIRAIRRREFLQDQELLGITAGLTEHNKNIEIHRCRFASVVATHFLAGTNIFDVNGNRLFDGLRHVSSDSQWNLIHSQSCPNVLRICSIVVTKDSKMIAIFDQTSSFFTQKTWQPLINGFVTVNDYNRACNVDPDPEKEFITFDELAYQTVVRKLEQRCDIRVGDMEKKPEVQVVGVALDTIRGRIPTIFTRTKLDIDSHELSDRLTERFIVHRIFKLIRDYPQASYQELLESSSYQDAEMLRANLYFTLKFEPDSVDASESTANIKTPQAEA